MLLCYRWTGNTATFQADHEQVHNPVLPTGVLRHKDWNNSPATLEISSSISPENLLGNMSHDSEEY